MNEQLILWLVTLVVAGAGAWIGSYLREKGKNYATKEDVQALTRLTESVRADISGRLWLDQKRWDLKRDFYWQLLAEINSLAGVLRELRGVFKGERGDVEQWKVFWKEFASVLKRVQERDDALARVLGIGRILLPDEVLELIDTYRQELKVLERDVKESMEKFNRSKKDIDALTEAERTAYFDDFLDNFPKTLEKFTEDVRAAHIKVMPKIIQAARHDLLSLGNGKGDGKGA